ncbi:hypothetical protein [Streptomyces sp. NPDC054887]
MSPVATTPETKPAPVPVTISPRPLSDDEITIVGDLDELIETVMCSCNAGDDQPY